MKISAVDGRSWLRVDMVDDGHGYTGFDLEAYADIGHGRFTARNTDVQLLDLDAFVAELDAFVLDRTLRPRLDGTYDTFVAFEAVGNGVLFSYCLGDALMGRPTHRFTQTGAFEIDGGSLPGIVEHFREMTSERRAATNGSSTTH